MRVKAVASLESRGMAGGIKGSSRNDVRVSASAQEAEAFVSPCKNVSQHLRDEAAQSST